MSSGGAMGSAARARKKRNEARWSATRLNADVHHAAELFEARRIAVICGGAWWSAAMLHGAVRTCGKLRASC